MESSKITDLQVKIFEIPLKKKWEISLNSVNAKAHAFIQIITEDGIKGFGEASPAPYFMSESAYTIETVIHKYLKNIIVGTNIFDVSKIHSLMDKEISSNTAAKAAIDIAVHDAIGKTLKIPVYKILGGQFREDLNLAWSVGLQDIENSVIESKQRLKEGYKEIKVKVGKDFQKDAKLILQIREELGEKVPIRIDANQGFSVSDALHLLQHLGTGAINTFEQPVPKWDIDGLKFIRERASGVKIMADESISSLSDAGQVIASKSADCLNIKVGKVGGLYRACQIAGLAEASGLKACAGSNLELGIGEAASMHFVTSQAALSLPCDMLCGTELHKYDILRIPIAIDHGITRCSNLPGLGIEIDESIFD